MPKPIEINFEDAFKTGNLAAIQSYLHENNNAYFPRRINEAVDSKGHTLLHYAARFNQKNIMAHLLKLGAKVNCHATGSKYSSEDTPLHVAAENNSYEAMELLLDNHAIIEARNKNGYTPLHSAVEHGKLKAVDFLLDKKANVDAWSAKTAYHPACTPILLACTANITPEVRSKIFASLIRNHVDLEATAVLNNGHVLSISNYAKYCGAIDVVELMQARQKTANKEDIAELKARVKELEKQVHKLKKSKHVESNEHPSMLFSQRKSS